MDSPQTMSRTAVTPRRSREGKPVSLRDVAKLANVSVATVSMVINDNPRISRATHMKVQRLIERLGYRPNRLAQSLSGRYTQVLAVMLPALRHTFADAYFGELISGICDRAGKLGYKVMLEQAKPEFIKERKHIDIFERRYVDGMLCMGLNDRHFFLSDFSDNKYPCLIADNYFPKWKLDHVVCDYRGGAEQAMSYLLQLGHKKIGLICAASEIQTCRDVMDVYTERLRQADQPVDMTWTEDGQFTESGGATATELLLSRHPDLTALLACNDKMAVGALHYLAHAGIKVPDQISVLGFDDLRHTAFITPSLTTVHLPLYQVGANACERLVERIHGRTERVAETLPTHLVLRASTAMVRK